MIIRAKGSIALGVEAGGHFIYPGYMIEGETKSLMIEAGLNRLGPIYLRDLDRFLGDHRLLDYAIVTQSHYDHLGALPYLKRKIPNLEIGAAPLVGELMQKPKVLSTMNFLSSQLGDYFKDEIPDMAADIQITALDFDLRLGDGDVIDLGGVHIEVVETPGHTRDHLSYYLPERSMLFPGEALGNPAGDGTTIKVEFVTSYTDYMNSIEKLSELNPDIIAMSHMYVYHGEDARRYMQRTGKATVEYRKLIEEYLDQAQGDSETAVDRMVAVEYDQKGDILMERNAYIANLNAQVRAVREAAC